MNCAVSEDVLVCLGDGDLGSRSTTREFVVLSDRVVNVIVGIESGFFHDFPIGVSQGIVCGWIFGHLMEVIFPDLEAGNCTVHVNGFLNLDIADKVSPVHDEGAVLGVVPNTQVNGVVHFASILTVRVLFGIVELIVPIDSTVRQDFLDSAVGVEEDCTPSGCKGFFLEEATTSWIVCSYYCS